MDYTVKLGVDIGGTLIKVALQTSVEFKNMVASLLKGFSVHYETDGNTCYCFFIIKRKDIGQFYIFFEFLKKNCDVKSIGMTGGGAFCFEEDLKSHGIEYKNTPEFIGLKDGLIKFTQQLKNSLYSLDLKGDKTYLQLDEQYPFLLVNIGSGCSMNLVEKDKNAVHVNGTSFGGTTVLGYAKMFYSVEDYQQILSSFNSYISSRPGLLNGDHADSLSLFEDPKLDEQTSKMNMISSFIIQFLDNISGLSFFTARSHKVNKIIYIGHSISENLVFQRLMNVKIQQLSKSSDFEIKVI